MHGSKHHLLSGSIFGYLLLFVSLSLCANAQTTAPNEWTWMGGSSTANQPGVYGTLGTPSTGNIPGGRDSAVSWKDNSGNFWLFGGEGHDAHGASGELNDLWQYNPSAGTWAWMGGSSTIGSNCVTVSDLNFGTSTYCGQPGIYGLGTPDTGNIPGGRYGAVSWTDSSGNFWLFGGEGFDSAGAFGELNDLWEFNPSNGKWAWISGSNVVNQSGAYVSQGTPASGNMPGGRYGANSWIDGSGNLWLFGGWGHDSSKGDADLNDLWYFNPSTKQWTWMNGSSTAGQNGTYSTIGTPAPGNTPNSRYSAVSWTDNNGNFWLTGGEGYSSISQASTEAISRAHPLDVIIVSYYLPPTPDGDLWEFDIAAQQWVMVSPDAVNSVPGTLGVPSAANGPSGEDGGVVGSIAYTGKSSIIWILSPSSYFITECNDLMDFNPSTSEWAWMGGSCSYLGVYGTKGVAAAGNIPGGRAGEVGWTDSQGNFWLFGGSGADSDANYYSGDLNDLWMYQPSATTLPPAIMPQINLNGGVGGPANFPLTFSVFNGMTNAVFYYTTDGTTPTTNSTETSGSITLTAPATVKVISRSSRLS